MLGSSCKLRDMVDDRCKVGRSMEHDLTEAHLIRTQDALNAYMRNILGVAFYRSVKHKKQPHTLDVKCEKTARQSSIGSIGPF